MTTQQASTHMAHYEQLVAAGHGHKLRALGVRIGDQGRTVRRGEVLSAEPWKTESTDGSVERVCKVGGWLRGQAAIVRVADGIVDRIVLTGLAVKPRRVKKDLGPPEFRRLEGSGEVWSYPSRDCEIFFSDKRAVRIFVGSIRWSASETAANLTEGKLQLPSGREIGLVYLQQSYTYEGLLEGFPTREMNRKRMEFLASARHLKGGHPVDSVLEPKVRPIEYEGRYPFGTPEALPSVTCIARFKSAAPARDPEMFFSYATVAWFQDSFALPIAPRAVDQLRNLDWAMLAHDDEP